MKKSIRTIGYFGVTIALTFALFQSGKDTSLPEPKASPIDIGSPSKNLSQPFVAVSPAEKDTDIADQITASGKTTTLNAGDSYILSCEKQNIQYIHQGENLERELANYNLALRESNKANEQLAFYLSTNEASTTEAFEFLSQFSPDSPAYALAYDQLLNLCFAEENIESCDTELLEIATEADANNGMPWLNIAALYQKKGEQEKALEALQTAIKKPFFDDYHWQLIDFLEQVSESKLNLSYMARLVSVIGIAAAKPSHLYKVLEMCKDEVANDPIRADVCLSLGKQMEKNSTTTAAQGLGLSLQKTYYEQMQDKGALAAISKKQSRIYYDNHLNETTRRTWQLMNYDDDLFRFWLQNMLEHGEAKGMQHVIEEAIWRSRNPNYTPCSPSDDRKLLRNQAPSSSRK